MQALNSEQGMYILLCSGSVIPSPVVGAKRHLEHLRKEGGDGDREGGEEARIKSYSPPWTLNLEVPPRFEGNSTNPVMSRKVSVTPERIE